MSAELHEQPAPIYSTQNFLEEHQILLGFKPTIDLQWGLFALQRC